MPFARNFARAEEIGIAFLAAVHPRIVIKTRRSGTKARDFVPSAASLGHGWCGGFDMRCSFAVFSLRAHIKFQNRTRVIILLDVPLVLTFVDPLPANAIRMSEPELQYRACEGDCRDIASCHAQDDLLGDGPIIINKALIRARQHGSSDPECCDTVTGRRIQMFFYPRGIA
jgi:hypothetical protein